MSYDNTNTGILTRNIERDETRKQPQYRGSMNVDGVEYWISAWVQEGKPGSKLEGQKYFSMKLEPKPQATVDPDIPF